MYPPLTDSQIRIVHNVPPLADSQIRIVHNVPDLLVSFWQIWLNSRPFPGSEVHFANLGLFLGFKTSVGTMSNAQVYMVSRHRLSLHSYCAINIFTRMKIRKCESHKQHCYLQCQLYKSGCHNNSHNTLNIQTVTVPQQITPLIPLSLHPPHSWWIPPSK